ncbi:MAG: UDP-N-acetylmuramoyl-L-alanine--D-glutamate ligase [Treponema sp.]|nr:UDP-N-acetylmuramoyl-L-alanine--D-glutamate ligase [Treponema sp.]
MDYYGMKVLIMGLGLHGGGLESARYLLRQGADLTVTDLRNEQTLAPSIEQLEAARREEGRNAAAVTFVLGRHEMRDFQSADMVIKNPAVRPDSPYLRDAKRIETDISLFLAASPARLGAVTGSKGKSGTASAIHWVLARAREAGILPGAAWLGGNITVSPLSFLDRLGEADDVTLELSSWQLGDLKGRIGPTGGPLLKPKTATLTAIMPDHLDRYSGMETYVADKRIIYQGQNSADYTIAGGDEWGRHFHAESRGRPLVYAAAPLPQGVSGGWLEDPKGPGCARLYGLPGCADGAVFDLVPARPLTPGRHQKLNLLAAGLALLGTGLPAAFVRESLETFPGIEHRLEQFHVANGVHFYNDSAATIPEAAAAAIEALGSEGPVVLVTGGTDKNLDFSPLVQAAGEAKTLVLLAGSGSEKFRVLLDGAGVAYRGPFDSLDRAVLCALESASPGDQVALSPGCASFGMFLNEFDRGQQWKEAIRRLA